MFNLRQRKFILPYLGAYVGVLILFLLYGFDLFTSDAKNYWIDSLTLAEPFHPFHVPGYPALLALFRSVTFNLFSPIFYLQLLSFLAFTVTLILFFSVNKQSQISIDANKYALALFMFYPMVGIVYIVYPVADALAFATFVLGIFFFLKEKYIWGSLAWAGALFVHKALWIYVALAWFIWAFSNVKRFRWRVILYALLIIAPLMLYAMLGAFYHHNPFWLISSNLSVEVSSRSTFPILDGVFGTFQRGGMIGMVKGSLLLTQYLFALWMLVYTFQRRYTGWEFGLATATGTLILMTFVNQYEIWATLRFGRLLAFPFAHFLDEWLCSVTPKRLNFLKRFAIFAGVLLYISQLFYAWYFSVYFA